MNQLLHEFAYTRQIYRNVLNLYWLTIVLTVVLEYALHVREPANAGPNFVASLAFHAFGLAAVTGVAEMLYRYRQKQSDSLLFLTGTIYAVTIIWMNPKIGIVPAIFIFPILTSVLSFKKWRIVTSYFLILLAFALLYALNPELRAHMQPVHTIGLLFLYTGVTVIALAITSSGIELLHNLKRATEARQDLLVQNIIMDKLAKMDALTELYNHKTFHEYLEKLIEQSERNALPLQLAILDIDNFKMINDTYGHWVGDLILMRVGSIVRETVTPNDFVARYGGEEFAVVFTEKTQREAFDLVEQIRQRLSVTIHPELDSKAATMSIGLQAYSQGLGKEALFKGADAALYEAKRSGKNKTVVRRVADGHQAS